MPEISTSALCRWPPLEMEDEIMIFKKKDKEQKEHTLLSQIAKYVTAALVLLVLVLLVLVMVHTIQQQICQSQWLQTVQTMKHSVLVNTFQVSWVHYFH